MSVEREVEVIAAAFVDGPVEAAAVAAALAVVDGDDDDFAAATARGTDSANLHSLG
jgi:hypothetical protein